VNLIQSLVNNTVKINIIAHQHRSTEMLSRHATLMADPVKLAISILWSPHQKLVVQCVTWSFCVKRCRYKHGRTTKIGGALEPAFLGWGWCWPPETKPLRVNASNLV